MSLIHFHTATTTTAYSIQEPSQKTLKEGFRLVNLSSHTHLNAAIEKVISATIVPLYGEQSSKLAQIKCSNSTSGSSRLANYRCEVLLKNDNPVGFIIYNTQLQPCLNKQTSDSLELCHLELIDYKRDAGEGYRTLLLRRVEEIAKEFLATSIHTTLANQDHLTAYLKNKNFQEDRNTQSDTRAVRTTSLLYHKLPKEAPKPAVVETHNIPKATAPVREEERDQKESKKREATMDVRNQHSTSHYSKNNSAHVYNNNTNNRDYNNNNNWNYNRNNDRMDRDYNGGGKRIKMEDELAQDRHASQTEDSYRVNKPRNQLPPVQIRNVTLPRKYIHQIREGTKTIEGRINNGQFKYFKVGDKVRFFYTQNPNDDVTCEVTEVKKYCGFPEMLTSEGFKKCVPQITTYDQACREYDTIPNYTANAKIYGVLAIHIKVVKQNS